MAGRVTVNLEGIDGGYVESFSEYWKLLLSPKVNGAMFQCSQPDWKVQFEMWNVVYILLMIVVTLLFLLINLLGELLHLKVISMVLSIVFSAIALVLSFACAHMGWYCIVKKDGCCGKTGYLVWGLVYLVCFLPIAINQQIGPLYCLMLVPVVYLEISLFHLFNGSARGPLLAT
mmetsp:Transcript_10121/g.16137  ORF Transcript_10121/g.16137 Transcript_10121/m.16137 type:complete len:174 (-) Transcript_10121:42-563(-)